MKKDNATLKLDFYSNLLKLCELKGVKITNVVKELNMSTSLPTSWKNGIMPSIENAIKLAEYFDVSLDELIKNTSISIKSQNVKELSKEELIIIKLIRALNEEETKELSNFVDYLISKRK